MRLRNAESVAGSRHSPEWPFGPRILSCKSTPSSTRWRKAGGSEHANYQLFIADVLTATPQDEAALASRSTGKGPWKKCLPEILAMLAAVGRAKQSDGGWVG